MQYTSYDGIMHSLRIRSRSKKNIYFLKSLLFLFAQSHGKINAQALGLNNSSPNASSILDAVSTTKGILIPRMTTAQRDAISSPATALLVYVTDKSAGFYYYDGSKWETIFAPSSFLLKVKTHAK